MDDPRDQTAVVTGGSRGFGRGIVEALAGAGMRVVALARDPGTLAALAREVKGRVETVAADATDPVTAARVIDRERPRVLVLNAGATGPHRPTRLQTWETFSVFWQTDVRSAFLWVREALALPLERGSTIFIGSSTAGRASRSSPATRPPRPRSGSSRAASPPRPRHSGCGSIACCRY